MIPPILNLVNAEPDPALNYAKSKIYKKGIKYGLKNSFGFGGANVSILYKKN